MALKPEKFPDWATEEEVDPVSGQVNRVEPPDFRKVSGWTRREIPPRQWLNWLTWKTARWIQWAEDGLEGLQYATEAEAQAGTEAGKVLSPLAMRQGFNADNAPPVFGVRAWANFDGTTDPPTIRGSGNIASVVKDSIGEYTINFDVPMPDTNYSLTATINANEASAGNRTAVHEWQGEFGAPIFSRPSASYCRVVVADSDSNTKQDTASINIAIFR